MPFLMPFDKNKKIIEKSTRFLLYDNDDDDYGVW